MIRTVTQILMGFMLLFGTLTLAPRVAFHFKNRNTGRMLYLLMVCLMCLFFSVMSFYYALI